MINVEKLVSKRPTPRAPFQATITPAMRGILPSGGRVYRSTIEEGMTREEIAEKIAEFKAAGTDKMRFGEVGI